MQLLSLEPDFFKFLYANSVTNVTNLHSTLIASVKEEKGVMQFYGRSINKGFNLDVLS